RSTPVMDDPRATAPGPHAVKFHPGHRPGSAPVDGPRLSIIAYERSGPVEHGLFPMPPRRGWMDRSAQPVAYRCLPLVVANQAGWAIRNPITFSVMWNGGVTSADVQIIIPPGQGGWAGLPPEAVVESHFGEGVLTFQLPFLFRTSEGYNLWV